MSKGFLLTSFIRVYSMTINDLVARLQDLLKNPENDQLEVVFEDTIDTMLINRVYVASSDDDAYEDNEDSSSVNQVILSAR